MENWRLIKDNSTEYYLYQGDIFQLTFNNTCKNEIDQLLGLKTVPETAMRLINGFIIVLAGDHRGACETLEYDAKKCWEYFQRNQMYCQTPFQQHMKERGHAQNR
jgi:hypothetical protein